MGSRPRRHSRPLNDRIAPEYHAIDPGLVHEALSAAAVDVRDSLAAVRAYLTTAAG